MTVTDIVYFILAFFAQALTDMVSVNIIVVGFGLYFISFIFYGIRLFVKGVR